MGLACGCRKLEWYLSKGIADKVGARSSKFVKFSNHTTHPATRFSACITQLNSQPFPYQATLINQLASLFLSLWDNIASFPSLPLPLQPSHRSPMTLSLCACGSSTKPQTRQGPTPACHTCLPPLASLPPCLSSYTPTRLSLILETTRSCAAAARSG